MLHTEQKLLNGSEVLVPLYFSTYKDNSDHFSVTGNRKKITYYLLSNSRSKIQISFL